MIRLFSQYVSPKTLLLVGLETVLISLSLLCAVRLRFWNDASEFQACTGMPHFAWQLLVVVVVFQACFYLNDLYAPSPGSLPEDGGLRVGQSLGAASLLLGVLYYLIPGLLVGHGVFFLNMILAGGLVFLSRVALDRVWSATPAQNIVILGAGAMAATVAREIGARRDLKWNLLGFVQDASGPSGQPRGLSSLPLVGHSSDLEALALKNRVARIIVALEDRRGILPTAALVKLRVRGVVVEDAHSAISSLTGRVWLSTVRPSWFVFSDGFHRSPLTASSSAPSTSAAACWDSFSRCPSCWGWPWRSGSIRAARCCIASSASAGRATRSRFSSSAPCTWMPRSKTARSGPPSTIRASPASAGSCASSASTSCPSSSTLSAAI